MRYAAHPLAVNVHRRPQLRLLVESYRRRVGLEAALVGAVERIAYLGVGAERLELHLIYVLRVVPCAAELSLIEVAAGMHALLVEPSKLRLKTLVEVVDVLLLGVGPLHLSHSHQSRISHILQIISRLHILAPKISLRTYYVLLLLRRKTLGQRIVRIHAVQRQIAANGKRSMLRVLLIVVDIAVVARRHYHLVLHLRSLNAAHFASPRHHGGVRRQSALQNLVPADDALSLAVHEPLNAMDEPALQLVFVLQIQFLYQRLAARTNLPRLLRTLVAADVYILAREQIHHLRQHVLQEFERLLLRTVHLVEDVHIVAYHILLAQSARILRISSQRRRRMSRHFNLGYNRNESVGSIRHHLLNVLLRVETLLRFSVESARIVVVGVTNHSLTALRSHLRK